MGRRISWDEPSLTLTTSPAQKMTERCHPEETRPFTIREYARIQTFPDTWKFVGSNSSQYRQIGNAIPVLMAKKFGLSASTSLPIQGEKDGLIANKNWKKKNLKRPWVVGDSFNAVIGQGYNLVSNIQLAVMISRFVSGKAVTPKIITIKININNKRRM